MSDASKRVEEFCDKWVTGRFNGDSIHGYNDADLTVSDIRAIIEENKRLREAINRAVCSMHVDCDTGFLCLSDFDFWELKMAVKGK